jgi:hypothetical protein
MQHLNPLVSRDIQKLLDSQAPITLATWEAEIRRIARSPGGEAWGGGRGEKKKQDTSSKITTEKKARSVA